MIKKITCSLFAVIIIGLVLLFFPRDLPAAEPKAPILYRLLVAETALQRGNIPEALSYYLKAAEESQDPSVAATATQLALEYSDVKTALIPAKIWAAADPKSVEAQLTTAALYIRLGKSEEAVPYLQQLMVLEPELADQHFIVLYTELNQPQDKQAVIQALVHLTEKSPQQALSLIALSDIALQAGSPQHALALAEKALAISPESSNAKIVYAESVRQTQNVQIASKFVEQQLVKNPKDAYLRHYLTQLYLDTAALSEAKQHMTYLSQQKDLPFPMLVQLTKMSLQSEWFSLAKHFLISMKQDPLQARTAYYFLGRVSEMEKLPKDAIIWYQKVDEGPFAVMSALRAAVLLQEAHQYEEALATIDAVAPQTVGDLKRLVLLKTNVLSYLNKYDDACQTLTKTLKILHNDADLLFARGITYEQLKQYKEAEADFRQVLILQPTNAHAVNSLGRLMTKMGEKKE
jgi:tetratricopeptide (TPR) repeat protein